jgi:hypothetical protein
MINPKSGMYMAGHYKYTSKGYVWVKERWRNNEGAPVAD